ncbi:hypothetical protein EC973_000562 [Apophysomyces ossiformis]|uniref:C-factor n=1 Tax=Apophysomyces ossiformis TaxID=679940 RepID=A0A8H7EPX2_9FUNG|nr:hypothetical protein EC973_000562 [Apophysomyces ossiformis]
MCHLGQTSVLTVDAIKGSETPAKWTLKNHELPENDLVSQQPTTEPDLDLNVQITGASRGLGLEFVRQLSEQGHKVIAAARSPEKSSELQAFATKKNIHTLSLDIVDEASVNSAADKVSKIAPEGIDILINNSGVLCSYSLNVETVKAKDYMRIFETNVAGTATTTVAFLEHLRKRKTRKIINISSSLGSIGYPKDIGTSAPAYSVSKAGENMLSKLFSVQLEKENFIVLALHPGWVKTDMGTGRAPLEPIESISGMLKVIENLTTEDNGKFLDYQGQPMPW